MNLVMKELPPIASIDEIELKGCGPKYMLYGRDKEIVE